MTLIELEATLEVCFGNTLCIDVVLCNAFPGFVRTVYLGYEGKINVQFEQYGWDEGGAYFYGQFSSLAAAVGSLEKYIDRPLSEWRDFRHSYPKTSEPLAVEAGIKLFKHAIETATVPLPADVSVELRASSGWVEYAVIHNTYNARPVWRMNDADDEDEAVD